jgi:carboxylate-amine ligase
MSEPLHLFEGYGIELEYMIVDRATLKVRPITDALLFAVTGNYSGEFEDGEAGWSNELVGHVIEFKTNGPAESLGPLSAMFARQVSHVNRILHPMNALLMPAAMHPTFDPDTETVLWQHEFSAVYEAYNRIFSCKGHGWSNLQSMHINLPFCGDEEFGRLHAAIRLVLPLLPGLAASSPMMDGKLTGLSDNRLEVYRFNSKRVPSMCGDVIPEPVFTRAAYESEILGRIYKDLAPHDPEGVLKYEFANSRGAIARFDRMAIEIRVIDVQECPLADLAIAGLVIAVVRGLVDQRWASTEEQMRWPVAPLAEVFLSSVRDAERAVISDPKYLKALGFSGDRSLTAGEVWQGLFARIEMPTGELKAAADRMLKAGTLATRITRALGMRPGVDAKPSAMSIERVYRDLCGCMADNRQFGV